MIGSRDERGASFRQSGTTRDDRDCVNDFPPQVFIRLRPPADGKPYPKKHFATEDDNPTKLTIKVRGGSRVNAPCS